MVPEFCGAQEAKTLYEQLGGNVRALLHCLKKKVSSFIMKKTERKSKQTARARTTLHPKPHVLPY